MYHIILLEGLKYNDCALLRVFFMGNILFVSYLASGQERVGVYLLMTKTAVHNAAQRQGIAIENARLTGDMQTAQELQSYYDSVLQAGQQNAANILAAGQWNIQNAQGQAAQLQQDAWTRAGLTGSYAGQQTLAGQQAALEFKNMDIQNQRALLELEIQRKFGWDQAAADLYITQKQGQGQNLSNIYQELQNSYARRMM